MRTTRKRAIALVPIVAVLLASCGGGGKSSDQSGGPSETTKAQAPASTTPGATGSTSAKEQSAAAAKTRQEARAKAREAQRKPRSSAGIEVLKRQAEEQRRRGAPIKKPKRGNSPPATTKPNPPSGPQPIATPQQVLGSNAKRVCKSLGVPSLAKRFNAAATPEAVATAYAQTYPVALRAAVHDGCLSAFNQ
jgi:hypothetical protein